MDSRMTSDKPLRRHHAFFINSTLVHNDGNIYITEFQ